VTVVYRTAAAADLLQLAQMRWDFRTGPDEPPPVVSREVFLEQCHAFLARGLERGDWVYWIAVEEGAVDDKTLSPDERPLILGHIFLHLFRPVPKPCQLESHYGYLTNVYTRPACRNQGIGSELMRHAQRWAKEHEVPFMIVSPSEASVPFYRRAGFTFETEFMERFLEH
jgi:ribosomal protein S18 acetylase RimI-like enzyme